VTRDVKIEFRCHPDFVGVFPEPEPASKHIPDYYRNMPSSISSSSDGPVFNDEGDPGLTVKRCMPVLDSLTAGYMIPLVTDVQVSREGDGKGFVWPAKNFNAIAFHPNSQFPGLDVPEEYDSTNAYKFVNPWQIVTPPGYSCLFVSPMWRYDLPFHTLPGVVDTDQHPVSVNFPFFMRRDFEGHLKKGTPIVQVIPFKREGFSSSVSERPESEDRRWDKARLQFYNRYKEHFRSPKSYR
jgi:hypothetical protein